MFHAVALDRRGFPVAQFDQLFAGNVAMTSVATTASSSTTSTSTTSSRS